MLPEKITVYAAGGAACRRMPPRATAPRRPFIKQAFMAADARRLKACDQVVETPDLLLPDRHITLFLDTITSPRLKAPIKIRPTAGALSLSKVAFSSYFVTVFTAKRGDSEASRGA